MGDILNYKSLKIDKSTYNHMICEYNNIDVIINNIDLNVIDSDNNYLFEYIAIKLDYITNTITVDTNFNEFNHEFNQIFKISYDVRYNNYKLSDTDKRLIYDIYLKVKHYLFD